MGCELDEVMWAAWQRVGGKVLGDEQELHRRLERRQKMFDRVPRPLCFAIRAGDRRINEVDVWLSVRDAMEKGKEVEHEVQITSALVRELCRPVKPYWSQKFRDVAKAMGAEKNALRRLERRGVLVGRRVKGLEAHWGAPIPMVDSPVRATASEEEAKRYQLVLDPGHRGYLVPDPLLVPYWRDMATRLPDGIEQMVRRKPVYRMRSNGRPYRDWTWVCPSCGRDAWTVYLPAGAPNWAAMHGIELPNVGWFEPPYQPRCFACADCHHVLCVSRTKEAMSGTWSSLIGHMSGGLLYGREVERPASFGVVRKHRYCARPRATPRRDELERYLVDTELSMEEIARRMGWMLASVQRKVLLLCGMRGVKGREGLREWWAKNRAGEGMAGVAA